MKIVATLHVPPKFLNLNIASIIHVKGDDRPHINVRIKSEYLVGLLDSGSAVTILGNGSEKLLDKFNFPRHKFTSSVAVADGTSHSVEEYIDVPFTFNGRCKIVPTLFMPSIKYALILGYDFWQEFHIEIVCPDSVTNRSVNSISSVSDVHILDETDSAALKKAIDLFPFCPEGEGVELSFTNAITHRINIDSSVFPVRQKQYVISPYVQKEVHEEIMRLQKLGIVKRVENPKWLNPIIAVRKSNGRVRIVLDARALNKFTKRTVHPPQNIDRILGQLRGTKFLTAIDLSDAYHQIKLDDDSIMLTCFHVPGLGVFAYTRMVQGCVDSASTLCQLIDNLFSNELEPYVFPYLDDIVVATNDFATHIEMLNRVALKLKSVNLKISPSKSRFCMKKIKYLGYVLNEDGISADPGRIQPIVDYPVPKCVKDVQRLIGMANWYRRFINDFSKITAAITDLLKKNRPFVWSNEADIAFQKLKKCLSSPPILATARYDLPFVIQCDASSTGAGAILTQTHEDGQERVVSFFSHKFSGAQTRYSATERECLSVLLALDHYRGFIEGVKFKVYTDHASLTWLKNLKDPTGKLARWALRMQAYDFQLEYRKGKTNVVPDAMSRIFESCPIDFTALANSSDRTYRDLKDRIAKTPCDYPEYNITNDLVYKLGGKTRPEWKLYIPADHRDAILRECHDEPLASHGGIYKTKNRVSDSFYWPNMTTDIENYVSKCETCKAVKAPNAQQRAPMGKPRIVNKPFRMISIDFQGPLPRSKSGNKWLLVVVDQFTKFVLLNPLREATAKATITFLTNQVFMRFGTPEIIILDNGSQLKSGKFYEMLEKYQIRPWYTALYHPQSNPTEAANATIKNAIKSYIKSDCNHNEWDRHLSEIECALNSSTHTQTKVPPFTALFGCKINVSGSEYKNLVDVNADSFVRDFSSVQSKIILNLEKAYNTTKKRYDLRTRNRNLNVGDIVWRRNFKISNAVDGYSQKLGHRYIKSNIIEKIGSNTYKLKDTESGKIGIYNACDIKEQSVLTDQ